MISPPWVLRSAQYRAHQAHAERDGYFSQDAITLDLPNGEIIILTCTSCAYQEIHCQHKKNTWHLDDTVLLCDICGADGT